VIVNNNPINLNQDEELEGMKSIYKKIYIVKSLGNIGFSKGNNLGYEFIKSKIKNIDFIICINSDILFTDNDFLDKIIDSYERDKWDVCGPDVLQLDEEFSDLFYHVSPISFKEESKDEAIKFLAYCERLSNKPIIYFKIKLYLKKVFKMFYFVPVMRRHIKSKKASQYYNNSIIKKTSEIQKNVIVYGCALVFSKSFIDNENKLFFPETKLYHEEAILFKRCKEKGYIMEYDPTWRVVHLDGRSTANKVNNNDILKQRFKISEQINATKIYINYCNKKEINQ